MTDFNSLPAEQQTEMREKQKAAKERKRNAKQVANKEIPKKQARDYSTKKADMVEALKTTITSDEYFDACPYFEFFMESLVATEANLALLMRLVAENAEVARTREGEPIHISKFNYFPFAGTDAQVWDPTFYAKLAWEGFFTITSGRSSRLNKRVTGEDQEALPELQPFYGVVDWQNFNSEKHMKKAKRKLKKNFALLDETGADQKEEKSAINYHLYNNRNLMGTYKQLDKYQCDHQGSNWMTRK